ncbi:MAG: NINE protein [Demequina sp.]|uniref:NINE protein n=1 Tax=Demequina sp. TaxID=2050685 RepID=UPI003A8A3C2C
MALVTCRECGREYSSTVPACVHCGYVQAASAIAAPAPFATQGAPAYAAPPAAYPPPAPHAAAMPHGQVYVNRAAVHYDPMGRAVGFDGLPLKSRTAYILLGLFLGGFGIHNFYAGRIGAAVAQLLITLCLGWVFGIGLVIVGIWIIVEMFVNVTDGRGRPLT